MKSMSRFLLVLCLACVITLSASAADKKKKKPAKGKKGNPAAALFNFPRKIKLTDEQKTKVDALKTEYVSKVEAAMKKVDEIMTADRKKAAAKAVKEARAAGKKGKELAQARQAALGLTADEKKALAAANKELASLRKEINTKKTAILTDEQKAQLKPTKKPGKPKKKKDAK